MPLVTGPRHASWKHMQCVCCGYMELVAEMAMADFVRMYMPMSCRQSVVDLLGVSVDRQASLHR